MNLLKEIENEQMAKLSAGKEIPEFQPGDTVIVNVKIVEGERSRVQAYEGVCIGRAGGGLNENFTVRKISYGEGVERVFPLYSPMIDSIQVVRRGKVRRAKLYYLRGRRGKSARIFERQDHTAGDRRGQEGGEVILNPPRRAVYCAPVVKFCEFPTMAKPRTLYDKIWDEHLIEEDPDGSALIYIDRHIVHEVTSPQAFEGLRLSGRKVHAPDKTLLVVDHNVPTTDRNLPNPDPESAAQIAYLAENAKFFNLEYYDEFDKRQGIVHIIGPEQGFTLPGVTLVCGDSHTATNGALRRARLRHRHLGSRARPGDADADPVEVEEHARGGRRQAAGRRHRQGHHPRHHRRDRHRRRHRLCAGICRRGNPRAVDGRPHDGLQHVGRGRRQGRLHRAGRKDLCVSERPPQGAERQGLGRGAAPIGRRCNPTTARISIARSSSTPRSCRRSSPGAPAPSRWSR